MLRKNTPPAKGLSGGPMMVACQWNISSPTGPAEHCAGGSRPKSCNSLVIRFSAIFDEAGEKKGREREGKRREKGRKRGRRRRRRQSHQAKKGEWRSGFSNAERMVDVGSLDEATCERALMVTAELKGERKR